MFGRSLASSSARLPPSTIPFLPGWAVGGPLAVFARSVLGLHRRSVLLWCPDGAPWFMGRACVDLRKSDALPKLKKVENPTARFKPYRPVRQTDLGWAGQGTQGTKPVPQQKSLGTLFLGQSGAVLLNHRVHIHILSSTVDGQVVSH